MGKKPIKPCGTGICPTPRDPYGVREHLKAAPKAKTPEGVRRGVETIMGQRNIDVFWEHMPWGDAQVYFERDTYVEDFDVGPLPHNAEIENYTIPSGMVLAITSIVFRATIRIIENNDAGGMAFARDDYFLPQFGQPPGVLFFPRLGRSMIVDKSERDRAAGDVDRSGYLLLNTDIMTSGVPFMIFAKPGQTFNVIVEVLRSFKLPTADDALVHQFGVHWQGVWIPINLYDRLRKEFGSARR